MSRDARRHARVIRIDRYRVRGAIGIFICRSSNHGREIETACEIYGQRSADEAGGVADHEGHLRSGEVLGGDDQVAFIFAGDGVQDDDGLAGGEGGYGGGDGVECWMGYVRYRRFGHFGCEGGVDGKGEVERRGRLRITTS